MGAWTQLFPPSPHFTEAQTPSLAGKVYIVTGGVCIELVKILYFDYCELYTKEFAA